MAFSLASTVCALSLIYIFLHCGLSADLRCYKGSFYSYEDAPVKKPAPLINSTTPCINITKCTFIYVFGLNGNTTGQAVSIMIPALIRYGKCNVLLLDWTKEASSGIANLGYITAVANTKIVGKQLGQSILDMQDMGLNKDITLIGHSLGAHLAGSAGSYTSELGSPLERLFALDPARPLFDPPVGTQPVNAGCAKLVVGHHTDAGGNAMNKSVGHVDFWPNFGEFVNGTKLQPGCTKSNTMQDLITGGNSCSHNFCINLFNSSLVNTMLLEGVYAEDYQAWLAAGNNTSNITNYMGLAVIEGNKGNFYLNTTGVYPYGKGADGLKP